MEKIFFLGLKVRDYLLPSFLVGAILAFILFALNLEVLAMVLITLAILSTVLFAVVDKHYKKVVGLSVKPDTTYEERLKIYKDAKK